MSVIQSIREEEAGSARSNQEYAVRVAERASQESVAAEAEGNFALANKKEFEAMRAVRWSARFAQDDMFGLEDERRSQ
jgi:hypothetical protein